VIYWKNPEDVMCQAQSESPVRTGRLVVNLATREVSVDDKPVRLTGKEYGILELLCRRKGTTLTKEMFLNHLYEGMNEPGLKIIDVFVCKLRKKLAQATGGKHYIETVWGRGYVLRDPAGAVAETTQMEPDHPGEKRFQLSPHPARNLTPHPAG
jgi:two-component system cell cycle response regulator CtrA